MPDLQAIKPIALAFIFHGEHPRVKESARGVAAPTSLPSVVGSGWTMCCVHDANALHFNWLCVRHCMSLGS